jgi:hypothetical protein
MQFHVLQSVQRSYASEFSAEELSGVVFGEEVSCELLGSYVLGFRPSS